MSWSRARFHAIPCALALLLAPLPAMAQNVGADIDVLAGVISGEGYKAKISTEDGAPHILSESSGSPFAMLLMGCTENRNCTTVQFYAGFSKKGVTLDTINSWNAEKRFGRAYLDDEGDPVIEMDINLDHGGVSRANFVDNLDVWIELMGAFKKHIDW